MFCGYHLQVLIIPSLNISFPSEVQCGQRTTCRDCPAQLPLLPPSPGGAPQLSVPQSLRAGTTATLFLQQGPVHRHGEGEAWIHRLWGVSSGA